MEKLEGAKYLGEVKPGTRFLSYKGMVIIVHPDESPMIVTPDGFMPMDEWHGTYRGGICQL